MLRPSVQPSSLSPCRSKAARACPSGSSSRDDINTPIPATVRAAARALRAANLQRCCQSAPRTRDASFDHLVCDSEQCRRHGKPKRPRSLNVDHQFKFRGLVHRYIGRLLAVEDTTGEVADYVIRFWKAWSVTH